mmetsp:Transcript_2199/g.3120  ORF Transcript_2199/g.3120 Transcript_2199/m.3120 type:complete len:91 (-) Transcript_2199:251-523(-)
MNQNRRKYGGNMRMIDLWNVIKSTRFLYGQKALNQEVSIQGKIEDLRRLQGGHRQNVYPESIQAPSHILDGLRGLVQELVRTRQGPSESE